MNASMWRRDPRLARAERHALAGEVLQAEGLYRSLLRDHVDCVPASYAVARMALQRDDVPEARRHLEQAVQHAPEDVDLRLTLAQVLWTAGDGQASRHHILDIVRAQPDHYVAWLLLADLEDAQGDGVASLRARFQAITRAQSKGRWQNTASTEPELQAFVTRHIDAFTRHRREHLFDALRTTRDLHGETSVKRVERALSGYLGDELALPPHARQRPKFFYFPDLPSEPYLDPYLHPWAPSLQAAWTDIRDEAQDLLVEDRNFESFLGLQPGQVARDYVAGANPNASWDAYFFYRHGQRLDASHDRCPRTSAALENLDLCHVANQAPEVCFSVLRPQSTIVAHHGVTNTRAVMHLPLIVPPDCALNVVDVGEHAWRAGELMSFDDTYLHEAWNRSNEPRVILLMDCWNPHLTPAERDAVKLVIERIDGIEN